MKLLRTMRFDNSDERVFECAAAPEEWAVSGVFAFANLAPSEITGKVKQAFSNGFLGVSSFGRSTFVTVAEAKEADFDEIVYRLARHFVENFGAPDVKTAWPAAQEEVEFVASLCSEVPINTVFTVRRRFVDGEIREEFRRIKTPTGEPMHARIWTVEPD